MVNSNSIKQQEQEQGNVQNRTTQLLLGAVLFIAFAVGLEWIYNFEFLKAIFFHPFLMAPTAVICFILLTLAFYMRISWPNIKIAKIVGSVLLLSVLLYSGLVIIDDAVGLDWHLGHLTPIQYVNEDTIRRN